jgi:hypothetical protein
MEWVENGCVAQGKRLVPANHKTNVVEVQNFLRDKLPLWGINSSSVEDICKNFKNIFESTELFVPHKVLKQNLDPEYYNKEVKRLKAKVRRAYNRKKLGEHYQVELKKLSNKLLIEKILAQETFLSSVLKNENKSLVGVLQVRK